MSGWRRTLAAGATVLALAAVACARDSASTSPTPAHVTPGAGTIELRGDLVKYTNWACHMSDNYVGGQRVTFTASSGGRVTITSHSANWVGLPADPPKAPFGQCRQSAPYDVRLPVARSYRVVLNNHRFPAVTLSELRAEGFRHTFRLPS